MTLALRFISGLFEGTELPLPEADELLVGRSGDVDLLLVDDMVSRKHAKIVLKDEETLQLTDLGSTNGTFVNGEKIRRTEVQRGDRMLIGTSILKVIEAAELTQFEAASIDREALRAMMQDLAQKTPTSANMSGDLDEVPVPDLLQLLASNQRSGVLFLKGAAQGKIHIKDGAVQHAVLSGPVSFGPRKALFRMVTWKHGSFELLPYDDAVHIPEPFTESTEALLLEAMRQSDELDKMLSELPPTDTLLQPALPLEPKLSELSAAELDAFQLVLNQSADSAASVSAVMDTTRGTDHEAVTSLDALLRKGYIRRQCTSDAEATKS